MPPYLQKPPRYMTAFMVYCQQHRRDLQGYTPQDAVRQLAHQWRNLEDKTVYEERSLMDKARWQHERRIWRTRMRRNRRRQGYLY